MSRLGALFAPASVAVVGANDDLATFGGRAWQYVSRSSSIRAVAVNPRRRTVGGVPCVPSLREVTPAPEAVFLATPANAALELIGEAAAIGTRSAVVLSRDLLGRETEIRAAVAGSGMLVLGPNCLGLINANDGVVLSTSISLERTLRPGPFALVSQSGALMGMLHARSIDLGIGLGITVSTGSQAIVRVEDVLAALAEDGRLRAVAAYMEDLDYPAFAAAANLLAAAHMRLVVLKSGSTSLGSAAATAHSGALASNGRVFAQCARDLGAVVVDDPDDLLPTLAATATAGRRWFIVTLSGGLAAVAADEAARLGLDLPSPGCQTRTGAGGAILRNPADLDAGPSTTGEKVASIRALAADNSADGVLVVVNDSPDLGELMSSLRPSSGDGLGRMLVASECSRQVDGLWLRWTSSACAMFPGLTTTLRALARVHPPDSGVHASDTPRGKLLPPLEVQALLLDAGMAIVPVTEVDTLGAVNEWASRIGYPVVLKTSRANHRGSGRVRVDLRTPAELTAAYHELEKYGQVIIQPQSSPGLEFYVGVRSDPVYGQLVLVGPGGSHVEQTADIAIGRSPMEPEDLQRLVTSTVVGRWLDGAASRGLVDIPAFIHIVQLAVDVFTRAIPPLESLDLNPVVVHPSGATVVDAKAWRTA